MWLEVLKTEVKKMEGLCYLSVWVLFGFLWRRTKSLGEEEGCKEMLVKRCCKSLVCKGAPADSPSFRVFHCVFQHRSSSMEPFSSSPTPINAFHVLSSLPFPLCFSCWLHLPVKPLSCLCRAECLSGCTLPSHCFDSAALQESPLLLAPDHSGRLHVCLCLAGRCKKSLILCAGLFLAGVFQR